MHRLRVRYTNLLALVALIALSLLASPSVSYAQSSNSSQLVTWTCTSSPCPWGSPLDGQALAWPAELGPLSNRFGYTTSAGVYLPANTAAGVMINLLSGAAGVYAGLPDAGSHRLLAVLSAGQSYQAAGLAPGEVVSVQAGESFAYSLTAAPVATPTAVPTETPTALPTATATALPSETATALPTETPTALPTATALPGSGNSQLVTWTCTGSPCPWGSPLDGQALVWPAELAPTTSRFGYTTSAGVYLPASAASGVMINLASGAVGVYAGLPDAGSHRLLAALSAGQSYQAAGLAPGEVVSVQGGESFAYTLTAAPVATPTTLPTETPTALPTATATALPSETPTALPTETPTALPTATALPGSGNSQLVTWTCTGSPCPWGSPLDGQALVWPAELAPTTSRFGYTTSAGVYLPGSAAAGVTINLLSGTVSVYAGMPDAGSHRLLAALSAGQSYQAAGLAPGEVVSVQSGESFAYSLTAAPVATPTTLPSETPTAPAETATPLPSATPTPLPTATATPACTDPATCNPVTSIAADWRCNIEGCTDPDWTGAVINWPSWAAYNTNARAGLQSRTVYTEQGESLYPYMGSWANGCQVTAVSGITMIIEWKRGTDVWREIFLAPGQTHTITLVGDEDGAMIESPTTDPFSVSLANCTPQNLTTPQTAGATGQMQAAEAPPVGREREVGLGSRLFLPIVQP